jgi:uncharacterized protein
LSVFWLFALNYISMAQNTNDQGRRENEQGRGNNFADLSEEERRELASRGGKAAHEKGTANEFDSETGQEAGRKGGQARQGMKGEEEESGGSGRG